MRKLRKLRMIYHDSHYIKSKLRYFSPISVKYIIFTLITNEPRRDIIELVEVVIKKINGFPRYFVTREDKVCPLI